MKRRLLALSALVSALVLAGCGSPDSETEFLAQHGLVGLDGRQIVEQLDASPEARPLAFAASVRETEVILADEQTEVAVDLPEDVHYVSVAPFVNSTHECYYHSLATCQGEMVEEAVRVTITDDDGAVLVDEEATTYANGFVGYWLPRDMNGTIEITHDERSGSVPFSTSDGDATCLTTLQLS